MKEVTIKELELRQLELNGIKNALEDMEQNEENEMFKSQIKSIKKDLKEINTIVEKKEELQRLEDKFTYENNLMIPDNQPLISSLIRKIQSLKKDIQNDTK